MVRCYNLSWYGALESVGRAVSVSVSGTSVTPCVRHGNSNSAARVAALGAEWRLAWNVV